MYKKCSVRGVILRCINSKIKTVATKEKEHGMAVWAGKGSNDVRAYPSMCRFTKVQAFVP